MRNLVWILGLLLTSGCLREVVEPELPPRPAVSAEGYSWPPEVVTAGTEAAPGVGYSGAEATPVPASFSPSPASAAATSRMPSVSSAGAPGGEACELELLRRGVPFERLDARKGVQDPVVVTGPIGSVRYVAGAGLPLELDCRMALTLTEVEPILATLGVREIRYSGAYVYRMSRVGRLSLHAYGLALDVHAVRTADSWYEVKTHFARGLADGCSPDAPVLNRVACELKRTGRFREMLTPDYNADHHDHLHWGIAPLEDPAAAPRVSVRSGTRP